MYSHCPHIKMFLQQFGYLSFFMLWSLLVTGSRACSTAGIVYSRDQLIAFLFTGERQTVPKELRRRRRGCRAGVKQRRKRRKFKPCIPAVFTVSGFHTVRDDRDTTASGKKKGGGLTVLVNNRWCHPGHISVKDRFCRPDIELIAIGLCPYYLPWEFTSVNRHNGLHSAIWKRRRRV